MFKEINTMELFFENPSKSYGVRESARELHITPATASKRLKVLAKRKLLKHTKDRLLDLYQADRESTSYTDLKTYYAISKLREIGLVDALTKAYNKPTIVLFGSAAHGQDTEESDIDIIVISERTTPFPEQKTFEKKLNRTLHVFPITKLQDLRNDHLINNALNGIVLQGELTWT